LVVPTYSYSIGRGTVFEVETTPSSIGDFPEVFRRRPNVIRSRDPMMSSAAIGPKAAEVLRNISRSCYGEGSAFHRLRNVNGKICTLGISLYWATFRHHIEEVAAVPFRFAKSFTGIIREHGIDSRETWSYFAAPLVDNCQPSGLALERKTRDKGLVGIAPVGRGEITAIDAGKYFEFGLGELRSNPWLTAKGPPVAAEVIFKDEPQWWAARSREGMVS
jgi:aminoglycoside 3-N-acetyltransferase